MYGTSESGEKGFRACVSDDLAHWTELGRVYEGAPSGSWATGNFWAPEVYEIKGKYHMFFSADWRENPNNEGENFRIGVAVSDSPRGLFTKAANNPVLQKNTDEGGEVTGYRPQYGFHTRQRHDALRVSRAHRRHRRQARRVY